MASFTTTPDNPSTPITPKKPKTSIPCSQNTKTTDAAAGGMASKIVTGRYNESNCNASIMYMNSIVNATAMGKKCEDSRVFLTSPSNLKLVDGLSDMSPGNTSRSRISATCMGVYGASGISPEYTVTVLW